MTPLPFQESAIEKFGQLADAGCAEQEGEAPENRELIPDRREGIDTDMPGAVVLSGMKLAKQIRAALV